MPGTSAYKGERDEYISTYTPSLLDSIPRIKQRSALGITEEALPFRGMDVWNAYEFTWLNGRGKPEIALAQFHIPAKSVNIIESKALKLYLGSYSNTKFTNRAEVIATLESDLTLAARAPVSVTFISEEQSQSEGRSLCPMTGQPDFASIHIQYNGQSISQEGLLKYLISYREHAEFAEQVVERIFVDIMNRCAPDRLSVQARFTRRGGVDINPYRSHESDLGDDVRVWRQ
jgi:7-cyano-7-deazaguanine reductase